VKVPEVEKEVKAFERLPGNSAGDRNAEQHYGANSGGLLSGIVSGGASSGANSGGLL
jgi:hypothetical protein